MFPHDHSELHKREKTARGRIGRRTERVGWGCTQRERKRARWGREVGVSEKAEGTGEEKVEQEKWIGDGEVQEER